ncbi:MAG: response regulator transcription factor [Ardenticatenales bacterium]|nr:response regulator transcription factor [Ardenticatenales bacterium]
MFPANETVRVLVVADDPLARAGLALTLGQQPGVEVVGQVEEAAWTVAGDEATPLEVYQPDVVLWDMGWEVEEGRFDVMAGVAELETPVAALLADEEMVAGAWAAGARGVLRREMGAEKMPAALLALRQGLVVVDEAFAQVLLPLSPPEPAPAEALTTREMEVLRLVAEGLSNRAIGLRLAISEHTVKFHITAIMGKLGAQSRTEAVVRATRLGMLTL